jgi:O-antigen ligase
MGRRLLNSVGLAAVVGMLLMPMFRSVIITLVIILVLDTLWERGAAHRAWRVTLIVCLAGAILGVRVLLPQVFEDRSDADNGYCRVAQYKQDVAVFLAHPLLGVGFTNFNNFSSGESQFVETFNGVESVDWPHSNLGQALAETGLAGFIPYLLMHLFLLKAMWDLRRVSASGRMVWKYSLYIFLIYWITGLTESSGFLPSVNTWYAFALAVCYKYAITEPPARLVLETEAVNQQWTDREGDYVPAAIPSGR